MLLIFLLAGYVHRIMKVMWFSYSVCDTLDMFVMPNSTLMDLWMWSVQRCSEEMHEALEMATWSLSSSWSILIATNCSAWHSNHPMLVVFNPTSLASFFRSATPSWIFLCVICFSWSSGVNISQCWWIFLFLPAVWYVSLEALEQIYHNVGGSFYSYQQCDMFLLKLWSKHITLLVRIERSMKM